MTARIVLAVPFLALAVMSSRPAGEGLIVMVDEQYAATVYATSDDGFAAPDGISWHQGHLYLTDEGGSAVVRLDKHGASALADGRANIRSPEDLVIDDDGTIFFSDDDAGGVWMVSVQGDVRQLAGKEHGLESTEGITLSPHGTILVGDGTKHAIFEVTREGKVRLFLGPDAGLLKPECLAFDAQANLYIADTGHNAIFRFDTAGRLQRLVTTKDGLVQPESICIIGGQLYITDDEAGKLYRYSNTDGLKTLAVFAGRLKHLQGICQGPQNSLLISVQDLKRNRGHILQLSASRLANRPTQSTNEFSVVESD